MKWFGVVNRIRGYHITGEEAVERDIDLAVRLGIIEHRENELIAYELRLRNARDNLVQLADRLSSIQREITSVINDFPRRLK